MICRFFFNGEAAGKTPAHIILDDDNDDDDDADEKAVPSKEQG